jgi:hypothetical protein
VSLGEGGWVVPVELSVIIHFIITGLGEAHTVGKPRKYLSAVVWGHSFACSSLK